MPVNIQFSKTFERFRPFAVSLQRSPLGFPSAENRPLTADRVCFLLPASLPPSGLPPSGFRLLFLLPASCFLLLLLVGLGRVELPTSPLSGVRSSHLSYRPVSLSASAPRSFHGFRSLGRLRRFRLPWWS